MPAVPGIGQAAASASLATIVSKAGGAWIMPRRHISEFSGRIANHRKGAPSEAGVTGGTKFVE